MRDRAGWARLHRVRQTCGLNGPLRAKVKVLKIHSKYIHTPVLAYRTLRDAEQLTTGQPERGIGLTQMLVGHLRRSGSCLML